MIGDIIMALAFTKYPANTFETLQINAGVVATQFDTSTGTLDSTKILGATTGGIQVNITPNFSDYGDSVDNVPANTKQLRVLNYFEAHITGSFVSVSQATAKLLAVAADLTAASGKIAPRADLDDNDFTDLWFIGDYGNRTGNGGFVAVKLIDALNVAGFQLQTQKNEKGSFSFDFQGHYDLTDDNRTPPFEIYVKPGSSSQL